MQGLAKAQASKFNNWRCNNGFLFPTDTIYQMIVYHTGGLHVGIANGGAKNLMPRFLRSLAILSESSVLAGISFKLFHWFTIGFFGKISPNKFGKTPKFFLNV